MPYRLLIADDSPLYRLRLSQIFAASDQLQIVGLAGDGRACIQQLTERRADILVLDLEMPELDGFSVLRWAMKHQPLPVVVCSGQTARDSVFRALEAGAIDFITKPELRHAIRSEEFAAHLRARVEAAASAHARSDEPDVAAARDEEATQKVVALTARLVGERRSQRTRVVGIVGSAGSPAAVNQILTHLPHDFTTPIIVALHMPSGFTRSFAERLARTTQRQISEARADERVTPSHVFIAPGGHHTSVSMDANNQLCFQVEPRDATDFYAPSADRLLTSLAGTVAGSALAVVLTGMGEDGLRGARAVHERGGCVIVESRESAVIWGMPRAVSEAKFADAELDPLAIAAALPLLCDNSHA